MFNTSEREIAARLSLGIIVAMTREGVIGLGGKVPWDLPADRRLFRRLTVGNTVIMGRRTFESLPAALPDRHNIVLSRTVSHLPGATVCPDLPAGLVLARQLGRPAYIIGGVEPYRQALLIADTLHISWVEGDYLGDRCFPPVDFTLWEVVETAAYPGFQHIVYRRRG